MGRCGFEPLVGIVGVARVQKILALRRVARRIDEALNMAGRAEDHRGLSAHIFMV